MGKLAWLTDPHFDMLNTEQLRELVETWSTRTVDGLLITGDIADGENLLPVLTLLDEKLPYPIWFILGNHDYYGTSIQLQREAVRQWCDSTRDTTWLANASYIGLSKNTALLGHGGRADGGYGDFHGSEIGLNDYRLISDLTGHDKVELARRLSDLGRDAAETIERQLTGAFQSHSHIILATHVPPFIESCWYQGQATVNEWTPHFSCKAVGDCLRDLAKSYPEHSIHVYCGHTHSSGVAQIEPNLRVTTGGATYGQPALQPEILFK